MRFTRVAGLAGLAGLGFVLVLIVANVFLFVAGFPPPSELPSIEELTRVFAAERDTLRLASAFLPASWLLAIVFAAGAYGVLGDRGRGEPWALVGLVGILMQCATFAAVEATRIALSSAATYDAGSVPGLWGLYNGLFGFNQVFLVTALVGLSISGLRAGVIQRWHGNAGLVGAVLLFGSASTSPYGSEGANPLSLAGLVGWLLWLVWIVAWSITLLRDRKSGARVEGDLARLGSS